MTRKEMTAGTRRRYAGGTAHTVCKERGWRGRDVVRMRGDVTVTRTAQQHWDRDLQAGVLTLRCPSRKARLFDIPERSCIKFEQQHRKILNYLRPSNPACLSEKSLLNTWPDGTGNNYCCSLAETGGRSPRAHGRRGRWRRRGGARRGGGGRRTPCSAPPRCVFSARDCEI